MKKFLTEVIQPKTKGGRLVETIQKKKKRKNNGESTSGLSSRTKKKAYLSEEEGKEGVAGLQGARGKAILL